MKQNQPPPPLFDQDDELQRQYSLFIKRLNKMMSGETNDDLENSNPKFWLRKLFATEDQLYVGIELIMRVLFIAMTKLTVEYNIESFVSAFKTACTVILTL